MHNDSDVALINSLHVTVIVVSIRHAHWKLCDVEWMYESSKRL